MIRKSWVVLIFIVTLTDILGNSILGFFQVPGWFFILFSLITGIPILIASFKLLQAGETTKQNLALKEQEVGLLQNENNLLENRLAELEKGVNAIIPVWEQYGLLSEERPTDQADQGLDNLTRFIKRLEAIKLNNFFEKAGCVKTFTEIYYKIPYLSEFLSRVNKRTEEATNVLIEKFIYMSGQIAQSNESAEKNLGMLNQSLKGKTLDSVIGDAKKALAKNHDLIDKLVAINAKTLQNLDSIEEKIKKVSSELTKIYDIATESKMIALNLSIESVQLGEKGKGIQVIVHEIQKLNDNTKSFTTDINGIIRSLEEYMKDLLSNWNSDSQSIIGSIMESNGQTKIMMNSLIQSYELTSGFFHNLSGSTQELKTSSDKVMESLQFQDITRQQIENVILYLKNIQQDINDLSTMLALYDIHFEKDKDKIQLKIIEDFKRYAKVIDEKEVIREGVRLL